jgi:O-antigen/teichoic acid export membrane protein
MTLQILVTPALNALGKQQVGTGISFCGALIMPTSYLIGVRAGIEGLAWSWLAGFALLTAITYVAARRHAGIPIGGVVRAVAPNLAAALIMAGVVWLVKIWLPAMPTPAALGILVTAGAASYFALLRVIAPDVVAAILDLARSRTGRPLAANA